MRSLCRQAPAQTQKRAWPPGLRSANPISKGGRDGGYEHSTGKAMDRLERGGGSQPSWSTRCLPALRAEWHDLLHRVCGRPNVVWIAERTGALAQGAIG